MTKTTNGQGSLTVTTDVCSNSEIDTPLNER